MNLTLSYYPFGKTKAVTLSYDDGRTDDRKLVKLCNHYGIKATFHLNSGFFGREGYVTREEIADLYEGHEVSVHTLTHPFLNQLPAERILEEIHQDRINLEKEVKYPVKGMSYPFGAYDDKVIKLIKTQGIVYSRTTQPTQSFGLPDDFLKWHPTCHHKQNLQETVQRFLDVSPRSALPLLYVWGHSYEFPRDDNWDIIEAFFKTVSGRDEIWFAANIDIYRYIQALRSLEFSANCACVHNPSGQSVWISVDNKAVEIKPNQNLCL